MFDTSIYQQGRGLRSGLQTGAAIGGMISDYNANNAVKEAALQIQNGANREQVIQGLMAKDPKAAQSLMNMLGGGQALQQNDQSLERGVQEIQALTQKVGMQSMQSAAMPLFGALFANDDKSRNSLITEAANVFVKSSPATAEMILGIKDLPDEQKAGALSGIVKTLRKSGIFPDDPSTMNQGGVAGEQIKMLREMEANNDPYAAQFKQMILPGERAQAQADVKVGTEKKLSPILANREAEKQTALEGTATGKAELQTKEQAVQKSTREMQAAEKSKADSVASINSQLQQLASISKHPGLDSAVGISSYAPSLRGGDAYNFERQLEKLDAQSFLAMVPSLSGMGALSNSEGAKVSASLSALDTGMSKEEFKRELKVIEGTLMKARERIGSGNLLTPEQVNDEQQTSQQQSNIGRFKVKVK